MSKLMQRFAKVGALLIFFFGVACSAHNSSQAINSTDMSQMALKRNVAGDRPTGDHFATRSPVLARNGMAATAHPLATQVALDVLKLGGTAVDAAIAADATLGLVEPTGGSIGGDLFALVWDPKARKLYGLNASGRSPQKLTLPDLQERFGVKGRIPEAGVYSVSVPGAVSGWSALHERFGHLTLEEVLHPAIAYAEQGFPVTEVIARVWEEDRLRLYESYRKGEIEEFENAKSLYFPNGSAPHVGDIFRNPDLGRTYRIIAADGGGGFYKGEIARTIDRYMKRIGGPLAYEDLVAHTAEWVEPVSVEYRGYRVYELPPNSQGLAALQMLQILEGYDLAKMGFGSPDSLHVQIEAKRLAYEDRAKYYADPAFSSPPTNVLVSDEYTDRRRALIRMDQAQPIFNHGDLSELETGGTTYLTVADKDGMMVSLIRSNYYELGSGLVPDGLGFMLHDRGSQFTLEEGHANAYAPGKRPFHTIIPAFVTKDGAPYISFGLMGGGMQPQGHVQILVNMIDYGMGIQEAGDAPRWRHFGSTAPTESVQGGNGTAYFESGFAPGTLTELQKRGHEVVSGGAYFDSFGGYQAILRDPKTGVYWGASEMRKDGAAGGY